MESPTGSTESQATPISFQSADCPPENAECDSASLATSDSFPGNPDWAILQVEDSEIQQQQCAKEAELSRKYSSYINSEPAFLFSHEKIEIPRTVNAIDRVFIKGKKNHILYKERKAIEQAAIYRDKCTELREKCRELEAVRYFWRNRVLEGQTLCFNVKEMCII